jgi:hypothetical protein
MNPLVKRCHISTFFCTHSKHFFTRFLAFFLVVLTLNPAKTQVPIAYYDFENNASRTTFDNAVEQTINATATALTKVGGSSTTVAGATGAALSTYYGGPIAGQAVNASSWMTTSTDPLSTATNFFQFTCSTVGFSGISINFDAFPSASNGPNRINLMYSIDGTTFNTLPAITASNAFRNNWTTLGFPLALADNQASVTIRIYGFAATNTTTGSLSLDNIEIDATATMPNAGIKNLLNELDIYTSATSGLTGTVFTRKFFTINTGSTLNLSSSFAAGANGNFIVAAGGTLNLDNYILSGMSPTATLTVAANANLITANPTGVQGGILTTIKSFSSDANYEFKGASTGIFTTSPTANTVNNLTIINAANLNLDMSLTIKNALNFTLGKLVLGANNLIIDASGAISGSNSSNYVVTDGMGMLTQTLAANTPKTFPIGPTTALYDPATITPNSVCAFKAKVAASITSSYTLSARQMGVVTPRQWDIALVSGAPTVTLALKSSDLTRVPSGTKGVIGHWNNISWDDLSADYSGGIWTAMGVNSFSPFIVSQPNTPLSITLENFTVEAKNGLNLLKWTTISEKNNAYFDVQHSSDGVNFQSIGQIKSHTTTSTTKQNYSFEHEDPSVHGVQRHPEHRETHYYRLRQVDVDGVETLSKIISIESLNQIEALQVYPNPAFDKLMIHSAENKTMRYSLFDAVGKHVESGQLNAQKELIISHLAVGAYLLKVGDSAIKFFKN